MYYIHYDSCVIAMYYIHYDSCVIAMYYILWAWSGDNMYYMKQHSVYLVLTLLLLDMLLVHIFKYTWCNPYIIIYCE